MGLWCIIRCCFVHKTIVMLSKILYNQDMRILGIDPGYGIVGFGIIDYENSNYKVVDYGVIETPKEEDISVRVAMIYDAIGKLTETFKPDQIAVEELFYFKNHNQKKRAFKPVLILFMQFLLIYVFQELFLPFRQLF